MKLREGQASAEGARKVIVAMVKTQRTAAEAARALGVLGEAARKVDEQLAAEKADDVR